MSERLLIIGTVWPEPDSSAAGSRMLQLIAFFRQQNYEITFATTASESEWSFALDTVEVRKASIKLNCSSFDDFVTDLQPDIVVFDRFMIEEQFGWRVAENCPTALRLLDTEDLHCLRYARQHAIKSNTPFSYSLLLQEDISKRELASIWRCDASLIISEQEMDILKNVFKVDEALLIYLPFTPDQLGAAHWENLPSFEQREGFISIGNFLHQPNWDAVLYLKEVIWPLIRKQVPKAEISIYGAYPTQKVWQLHQPKTGFLVKGRAENLEKTFTRARVCLAPLRFGAGLKGKLMDAMIYGTPSVTTTIGAEGMQGKFDWPGFVADSAEDFSNFSAQLLQDKSLWTSKQSNALGIINDHFDKKKHLNHFRGRLNQIRAQLHTHRRENFIGQLLTHHTTLSSKYLSKWIEVKNKLI